MSRRPRIALVVPTVELGQYWQPVLQELAGRTEAVRLFTAMPWRGHTDADLVPGGPLQVVGEKRRVTSSGDADSDYGGGVMVLSPAIAPALRRFRPDVVVVSGFSVWTMLVLALRPVMRWGVALLWEGSSPRVDFRDDARRTQLRRRIALAADSVTTNSPGGRDYLVDHLGLPPDAVVQTPYMVPDPATLGGAPAEPAPAEPARAEQAPDEPAPSAPDPAGRTTIVNVGRWEARKGVVPLLEAVAALPAATRSRVRLRLIGGGPQEEEIREVVASRDLTDVVEIVGWVPYESLGGHVAAADLLAFPTHEDTWGMVVLEAMAVGTPVLCSRWAGAHALVDPDLVIDPHDVGATAAALEALLADPDRLAALGAAAATTMAGHRPTDAADRLMAAARRAAGR